MNTHSPLKIKTLRLLGLAAPEQWEGILEDGRGIYIRERWGAISVEISKTPVKNADAMAWSKNSKTVFNTDNVEVLEFLQKFGIIKMPERLMRDLLKKKEDAWKNSGKNLEKLLADIRFRKAGKRAKARLDKENRR